MLADKGQKIKLVLGRIPGQVIMPVMGNSENVTPDPAAVLGAAVSLYIAARERAATEQVNISESYNGGDEFMRQVMRIATEFENWSCSHVRFEDHDEVWPYRLEDDFGNACLS